MAFADNSNPTENFDIALIGMAGRFPGASNLMQFWSNLRDGVESITFASDEELLQEIQDTESFEDPSIVRASSRIADIDLFDAAFFGYSPKEAALMDPQHRLLLECAWEALEHAGYNPETYPGLIGMYSGTGTNMYIKDLLLSNGNNPAIDGLQLVVGNDKDYLTTRVSYKLNLRGPSIDIQTACSTSLVAVHLACQSLLDYECDMALAGGVSIRAPQPGFYRYVEGSILSPDGHCRAFDAQGQGTIFGNGLGLVVLKRFDDAINDGDTIYAVIKGSAINNDGHDKIGYTAPGMRGQIEVIQHALDAARVDPATISYIEAHGTGTPLGDPIEFGALKHVFRSVVTSQSCTIGAVKTNIGHLDVAAGIAGLLKTVLALQHHQIPPTLHFQRPNPQIELAQSPFYINQTLKEWSGNGQPRRAGVSSFGIGGTNAHVILEEAPSYTSTPSTRPYHVLLLSAMTPTALQAAAAHMLDYLQEHTELAFADIAYTSQIGRKVFAHRQALVCANHHQACSYLNDPDLTHVLTGTEQLEQPFLAFLFTGQGSQYVNMAQALYQSEPVFQSEFDRCVTLFRRYSNVDIKAIIYPTTAESVALSETHITQPALFIIEYALAKLLLSWGIQPSAMIGHSIGEYVAACLAGVFNLEDGLLLVTRRGELMQQCQPGAMLSVALSEQQVQEYLTPELSLAAVNGPELTVVSGPIAAVEKLQHQLTQLTISNQKLHTSHAFHSGMMDNCLGDFAQVVQQVQLNPPRIPYLSNLTGTWIQDSEATDPTYWTRHLRQTVRFQQSLQELLQKPEVVLIEIGPGQALGKIVRQQTVTGKQPIVLPTLPDSHSQCSAHEFLLTTLARLWVTGIKIAWEQMYIDKQGKDKQGKDKQGEQRQRVALPTYPFERQRYWLSTLTRQQPRPVEQPSEGHRISLPLWKQAVPLPAAKPLLKRQTILLFCESEVSFALAEHLASLNYEVIRIVRDEDSSHKVTDNTYHIRAGQHEDYDRLVQELQAQHIHIDNVVHMWNAWPDQPWIAPTRFSTQTRDDAFYSIVFLMQALNDVQSHSRLQILLVSTNMHSITGEEPLQPQKALLLGPGNVLALEYPEARCQCIDMSYPHTPLQERQVIQQLSAELQANTPETVVAYRGQYRWTQAFDVIPYQQSTPSVTFRQGGTYLITGGLGGLGLGLAEQLARKYQARLALISRTPLPARINWNQWLQEKPAQDETSRRIQQLQSIEQAGGQVLVIIADVNDQEQMQYAIEEAREHFGALHGVLHLAGIPGSGLLQLKTSAMADPVLAPKTTGTLVLAHVLRDQQLDFLILFSSFTTITGGIGQVDYIAANAFLAAFAHYQQTIQGTRTIAIDWDAWQWDAWQGAEMSFMPELQRQLQQMRAEKGITFAQGLTLIEGILRLPCSQVVVTAQDIPTAIANHHQFAHTFWSNRLAQTHTQRKTSMTTQQAYVAPRNEIEETLAHLWQETLGLEQVGIHEHFIELGGHSLMAVQLLAKIRATFKINLPMNALFEKDTIASIAEVIHEQLYAQQDIDDLERLLQEIEGFSDEEVEALLLEEDQGGER